MMKSIKNNLFILKKTNTSFFTFSKVTLLFIGFLLCTVQSCSDNPEKKNFDLELSRLKAEEQKRELEKISAEKIKKVTLKNEQLQEQLEVEMSIVEKKEKRISSLENQLQKTAVEKKVAKGLVMEAAAERTKIEKQMAVVKERLAMEVAAAEAKEKAGAKAREEFQKAKLAFEARKKADRVADEAKRRADAIKKASGMFGDKSGSGTGDGGRVGNQGQTDGDPNGTAIYTPYVTNQQIASFPSFPDTVPLPSRIYTINDSLWSKVRTLGDVKKSLDQALRNTGYEERTYFKINSKEGKDFAGFAIAAQMEQIDADAYSLQPPDRWNVTFNNKESFSLESMMKVLFGSNPGYYRVLVFHISNEPFVKETKSTLKLPQARMLAAKGANTLDATIAKEDFTFDYKCNLLIYEFEIPESGAAPFLRIPSHHSGKIHITRSGLKEAIKPLIHRGFIKGHVGGNLRGRGGKGPQFTLFKKAPPGTVNIKVCVDENGRVVSVRGIQARSTTADPDIIRYAEQITKKWRFKAGDQACGTITYDF